MEVERREKLFPNPCLVPVKNGSIILYCLKMQAHILLTNTCTVKMCVKDASLRKEEKAQFFGEYFCKYKYKCLDNCRHFILI